MPNLPGNLNPGYQPPPGATLNEWGYWVLPDGNLAPGQKTPGSQNFTPVDASGNYDQNNIPTPLQGPSWTPDGPGGPAVPGVPGSPNLPAPTATTTTPPPTGGGGGGGGGSTVGNLLTPFGGTMPTIPSGTGYLPDLPVFTPPAYAKPPAYVSPTADEALNSPGYQFRLGQGEQALQQTAAARGLWATGGTGKAINEYAQNYASNEYANVDARNRQNYLTNYSTQYTDPYAIAYKGAVDAFAPKMTGYTTQAAAGQHASDLSYQNAYEQYLQKFRQFTDQRDSTWDKSKFVLSQ